MVSTSAVKKLIAAGCTFTYKLFEGMEGEGFNVNVSLNGKNAALAINSGNGGMTDVKYSSPELRDLVNTVCSEEPEFMAHTMMLPYDEEILFEDIVNFCELKKKADLVTTLFIKADQTVVAYSGPPTEEVIALLKASDNMVGSVEFHEAFGLELPSREAIIEAGRKKAAKLAKTKKTLAFINGDFRTFHAPPNAVTTTKIKAMYPDALVYV